MNRSLSQKTLTIRGRAQPTQNIHQGALPRAAVAKQGCDLALVYVKGQTWCGKEGRSN